MGKLVDTVRALAEPVAAEYGCEVWDVEYIREAGAWYLRVYIDKPGGVGIDDCEAVSRALDPVLAQPDPLPGTDVSQVSSAPGAPGPTRPGASVRLFGELVEVKHYQPVEGAKNHVGVLRGYENGDVTIEINGTEKLFKKAQVAQVRLRMTI